MPWIGICARDMISFRRLMAEESPRLLLVAHQSINARQGFSNPEWRGVDLTVNGGDPAFYYSPPRLPTFVFCSDAVVQLVGDGY